MTKVNKDPFSNGSEHWLWEQYNCDRCIKSSEPRDTGDGLIKYINEREDGMPKCSIQRDIVMRMFTNEPIKQKTIDICREFTLKGTLCPGLKTRRAKRERKIKNQKEMFE